MCFRRIEGSTQLKWAYLTGLSICHTHNCLWNTQSWETCKRFACKQTNISIWISTGTEWGLLSGQTKPNYARREGFFNVILSSTTLDKGLAALKLAITSKHSLWRSSSSLMGTWLMFDALKEHPSPFPNVEIKPRQYTNSSHVPESLTV